MAVTDGIIMKGRHVAIPKVFKTGIRPAPSELYGNRKNKASGKTVGLLDQYK